MKRRLNMACKSKGPCAGAKKTAEKKPAASKKKK
jgi:hypothetical protein